MTIPSYYYCSYLLIILKPNHLKQAGVKSQLKLRHCIYFAKVANETAEILAI